MGGAFVASNSGGNIAAGAALGAVGGAVSGLVAAAAVAGGAGTAASFIAGLGAGITVDGIGQLFGGEFFNPDSTLDAAGDGLLAGFIGLIAKDDKGVLLAAGVTTAIQIFGSGIEIMRSAEADEFCPE